MLERTNEMWNPKSMESEPEIVEISRGLATAKAYQKLTLLPEDINLQEVAAIYDAVYNDASNMKKYGELYIPVPLSSQFGVIELYHVFKEAYKANDEPYMPLWKQYDDLAKFGLPTVNPEKNIVAVRAMIISDEDNSYNETGLYLTDRTVKAQRIEGGKKIGEFNKTNPGFELIHLDPASYILINAIRIELKQDTLDDSTFTRFVGMKDKLVDGGAVRCADWRGSDLRLGYSNVDDVWDRGGVRFSVGEKKV
jgi:hypothetical protein